MKNLIYIILIFITSGCYHDYLIINSTFSDATADSYTKNIYFFHTLQAGKPPKGASRFPDGGSQKIVYKNLSMYCYNTENRLLNKVYDFGWLPEGSWEKSVSISKDLVAFNINPSLGWEWRKKNSSNQNYTKLSQKYNCIFIYNNITKKTEQLKIEAYAPTINSETNQLGFLEKDSLNVYIKKINLNNQNIKTLKTIRTNNHHLSLYWDNENDLVYKKDQEYFFAENQNQKKIINKETIDSKNTLKISNLKNLLKDISYKEWGFDLKDNWFKNKSEFMKDIVLLNGNLNYRRSIFESILFSPNEIQLMLSEIENRSNELQGYQKQKYIMESKETIELLKNY